MQRWVPLLQSVLPVRQGAPGLPVQLEPATQAPHVPEPLQTEPEPQLAPGAFAAPSMHRRLPVLQSVTPSRHGLPLLVHGSLAVHTPQKPAPSQT